MKQNKHILLILILAFSEVHAVPNQKASNHWWNKYKTWIITGSTVLAVGVLAVLGGTYVHRRRKQSEKPPLGAITTPILNVVGTEKEHVMGQQEPEHQINQPTEPIDVNRDFHNALRLFALQRPNLSSVDLELAKFDLERYRADVNAPMKLFNTKDEAPPLLFLINEGAYDMARYFIKDLKASVSIEPQPLITLLNTPNRSLQPGYWELAKDLKTHGLSVNVRTVDGGAYINKSGPENRKITPLIKALEVQTDNFEFVQHLIEDLDASVDLYENEEFKRTPLMIVIDFKKDAMPYIQLLMHHGANVNAQDADGATALIHAIAADKFDVAYSLINDYGADVTIKDMHSLTAKDYLAQITGDVPYLLRLKQMFNIQ